MNRKKRLYASFTINGNEGWGDSLPILWFCEYLYKIHKYKINLYCAGSGLNGINFTEKMYHIIRLVIWKEYYSEPSIDKNNLSNNTNSIIFSIIKYIKKRKFLHSNYILKPYYLNSWLSSVPFFFNYNKILVTHFNHDRSGKSWASVPYDLKDNNFTGLFPPISFIKFNKNKIENIFLDINADTINIIKLGFIPTFPSVKKSVFKELENYPRKYICIQGRRFDCGPLTLKSPSRNFHNNDSYDIWMKDFIVECHKKYQLPIIFTSDYVYVEGVDLYNASSLSFWAKLIIHKNSIFSYVAHSGFGMLISVYKEMKNIKAINLNQSSIYRNPPLILFPNCHELDCNVKYTSSSPGYINEFKNWICNFNNSLYP